MWLFYMVTTTVDVHKVKIKLKHLALMRAKVGFKYANEAKQF